MSKSTIKGYIIHTLETMGFSEIQITKIIEQFDKSQNEMLPEHAELIYVQSEY